MCFALGKTNQQLRHAGPLLATYMFPYERLYGYLKGWIGNKAYPESCMLKVFIKYQQALMYQAEALHTRARTNVTALILDETDQTLLEVQEEKTALDTMFVRPDYLR